MRLRREDVIDGAMALLDERGLDELTTRRLADRLGVQVGALYWHVRDKRELLVSLADRIVAETLPTSLSSEGDWAAELTAVAHGLRAAMLRHRDGARLVAAYAPASPRSLQMADEGLRAMQAIGVPLPAAAYVGDTLMSYVTGFVLQEQAMPTQPGVDGRATADFPFLAKWTAMKPATKDDSFAAGLDLIITGIRMRLFSEPG